MFVDFFLNRISGINQRQSPKYTYYNYRLNMHIAENVEKKSIALQ